MAITFELKVINKNGIEEPSCFSFDPLAILLKPVRHLEKISSAYKFIPQLKFIKRGINMLTYERFPKNKLVEVDWISGCCMFVSRKFFDLSNGFDERFFLYFDDVDLCRNAKLNNYKVIFDPRYRGIYESLMFNPTSRFHITSWLLYLIKWRRDIFYKLFDSLRIWNKLGKSRRKINFSVYKVFEK